MEQTPLRRLQILTHKNPICRQDPIFHASSRQGLIFPTFFSKVFMNNYRLFRPSCATALRAPAPPATKTIYIISRRDQFPGFPIVPAFRSFQLSGRSSCTVILAIFRSCRILKTKEILKGEARAKPFVACCLLSKQSPINFVGLNGNGTMYFKRKLFSCGNRNISLP